MGLFLLLTVSAVFAHPFPKQHYSALRDAEFAAAPLSALPAPPPAPPPPLHRTDTARWLGAEYTPSGATNELWLAFYPLYRAQVQRDLANARRRLAATTLRVFLHSLLWESDSAALLANLDDLLALAAGEGLRLGFVFFDSCWNATGASLAAPCEPIKGVHNGCWMQSPQAPDRTSVGRYEPYVSGVVRRFASDERVAWWEVYNEPHEDAFVLALRAAGYAWAKAQSPLAPVLSCWDFNTPNISDISDIHRYTTRFSDWSAAAYATPARGALLTEAGCRSYQAPFPGDAGSPLVVLHYLETLRAQQDAGLAPYVPGAMLAWEVMAANSNTRWHWGSPAGAPLDSAAEYVVEASLWPSAAAGGGAPTGVIELVLRAANASARDARAAPAAPAPCNTSVLPSSNACPGAEGETNFVVPPGTPDGAGACAAACCSSAGSGGGGCGGWVFLPGMDFDDKACACRGAPCSCCWLKPLGCAGLSPHAGCTAGLLPPPPPLPAPSLRGYIVALNYSAQPPLLSLSRAAAAGAPQLLGAFDLTTIENGVVDGFSLLRVVLRAGGGVEVYFNVALGDTGFVGNSSDAGRVPHAPAPRISVVDAAPLPVGGGLAIAAGGAPARIEYVGVLPVSVL